MNDADGAWWKAEFDNTYTIGKVKILNRGDCCGGRLNGAKVYIGENIFGTLNNPEQGKWATLKGRVEGNFIKIKGVENKYLHFCGLKVWLAPKEIIEEEKPEPPKPEPKP
jgi:hypothetical protein